MRLRSLLVVATMALSLPAAHAQSPLPERRYVVVTNGRVQGSEVVTPRADGDVAVAFEFNDRGRGPKLASVLHVGEGFVPTRVETSGVDYFKNTVAERFDASAGQASWKNAAEQGSSAVSGRAFYLSLNSVPEESALLARALLAASGNTLPLLPAGTASIRRVGEVTATAAGRTRTVVEYEIAGLDLIPTPIWLDTDGAYFGNVSGWTSIVPEGWESAIPTLLEAQTRAQAERTAAIARTLRHVPAGPLVVKNARLFDPASGKTQPETTVVVSGDRIVAVGRDGEVRVPDGAEVIDAKGMALLPGLWDMHVHLGETDGVLDIAAGVTSVRDLGNDTATLQDIRRRYDDGTAVGPRVLMAGLIDGPGPYTSPAGAVADTPDEARAAVDKFASLGYVQIKVYSSVKPELVPVIVDEAHKKGLRVSGHIPAFMTAEQAVRDGYDEIQHANFLFLNFFFDEVKDTRTPARFTAVAQHAAELDLGSDRVKAFVKLLKERKIVLDPTVSVFEEMFTSRTGELSPILAPVADRLPPQVRRSALSGGLPVPEGMDKRYRDSFAKMLELVGLMYREGVQIVAGTDGFAGFTLDRELENYVRAGIPAPVVLRIATLDAARVMHRDAQLGSVEKGKLADFILVDGDPARTIGDIRRVRTVVKGGVVYSSADAYEAMGIRAE